MSILNLPYSFTYKPSDFSDLTQKFERFFTRNGVRLIAEGLELKNKYKFKVNAE